MLVVTATKPTRFEFRREGADAAIGTMEVSVTRNGRVRVALDFPRDIQIWRGEHADQISERRQAGGNPNGKEGS